MKNEKCGKCEIGEKNSCSKNSSTWGCGNVETIFFTH